MNAPARPLSLLIAALGGEGGGVLTQWIVAAAEECGYPVQSTSIPGVAQRTGATTYYVEMLPEAGAARPIFALAPGGGDVDVVVASELLEAGRAIGAGFVTKDRTLLIASTSRSYIVSEKMAMTDGRYDPAKLRAVAESHAQRHVLLDLEALAKQHGVMINAVMLGVIAGVGALPIDAEVFRSVVRAEDKAVASNLRGFAVGFEAALGVAQAVTVQAAVVGLAQPSDVISALPAVSRELAALGVRRLTAYQDAAYAELYLQRLRAMAEVDRSANAGGALVREVARQLAVRMSYEDVIRVAAAKIDPQRLARLDAKADGVPYTISEFLKPGAEELCSVLPVRLGRRVLAFAEARGWADKHWGMEVRTTTLSGYARFWMLAKLRRWRRGTLRYAQENAQIEGWLALIREGVKLSPAAAIEIAECARLLKGYGDTLKRGLANYRLIEAEVIRPLLAEGDAARAADAIANARVAALRDPDGEALTRCIADIRAPRIAVAAE